MQHRHLCGGQRHNASNGHAGYAHAVLLLPRFVFFSELTLAPDTLWSHKLVGANPRRDSNAIYPPCRWAEGVHVPVTVGDPEAEYRLSSQLEPSFQQTD
jgi:hypothetical protein